MPIMRAIQKMRIAENLQKVLDNPGLFCLRIS
jgi:hypothetical protein